jgi:hypothetical protein
LAVTGFGGSAYWGFIRGADQMADAILNDPDYATSFWQNEIVRQRKIIANIRRDADGDIGALASKVGTIQA